MAGGEREVAESRALGHGQDLGSSAAFPRPRPGGAPQAEILSRRPAAPQAPCLAAAACPLPCGPGRLRSELVPGPVHVSLGGA